MKRLLIVLFLWQLPAQALGDDPDTEIAQRHFHAGSDAYERGDYPQALAEFEAARKHLPKAALDFNIARCHDRLEHRAEAIAAYQRYLASSPPDAAEVRERVKLLEERLRSEAPPAPPSPPQPLQPLPSTEVSKRPISRGRLAASIALGTGAVAAAAVGGGLVGWVASDYDRYRSGPESCRPCSDAIVAPLEQRAIAGYVLFGVAGALAVADVIVLAVTLRRR